MKCGSASKNYGLHVKSGKDCCAEMCHIKSRKEDKLGIVASIIFGLLLCIIGRIVKFELLEWYGIFVIVYGCVGFVRVCQFTSFDSGGIYYRVMGIFPSKIRWEDVSQIGICYVESAKNPHHDGLCREMFTIAKKPCPTITQPDAPRMWEPNLKLRHPFLIKNIYCNTDEYRQLIEKASRQQISFTIIVKP